jgi:hypothetical protein
MVSNADPLTSFIPGSEKTRSMTTVETKGGLLASALIEWQVRSAEKAFVRG